MANVAKRKADKATEIPDGAKPVDADAVTAWSAVNGADALGGKLGAGRDGNEPEA